MTNTSTIETLRHYVRHNEVVWQFCGDLVEVANDNEKENRDALLGYFRTAKQIEVYDKHDSFVADNWPELADWSTDDDVLFLLDGIGVLICVPKAHAIENKLIAA